MESSPPEETLPVEEAGTLEEPAGGARHRGREVALQVLFAIDVATLSDARVARAKPGDSQAAVDSEVPDGTEGPEAGARSGAESWEVTFDRVTRHFPVPKSAVEFARGLVVGVTGVAAEVDELLGQHARNWRVSRMAAVDRNVLRLAIYELRDTGTPVAVVIDEAVDLARRFGSDSSPSFVNGVLDAVAREVRAA